MRRLITSRWFMLVYLIINWAVTLYLVRPYLDMTVFASAATFGSFCHLWSIWDKPEEFR